MGLPAAQGWSVGGERVPWAGPVTTEKVSSQVSTSDPWRVTPTGLAENSGVKGLAVTTDVCGEQVTLDPDVAVISVVGTNLRSSHTERRMLSALEREAVKVKLLGSSEYSISFAVAREDASKGAEAAQRGLM